MKLLGRILILACAGQMGWVSFPVDGWATTYPPPLPCDGLLSPVHVQVLGTQSSPFEKSQLSQHIAKAIKSRGPFGQEMGVQLVNKVPQLYGTKKGVLRARPDAGKLGSMLQEFRLGGFSYQGYRIEEALGISGSAVEKTLYGDLDMEMSLVVQGADVKESDLHDPNSKALKALAKYMQAQVRRLSSLGFTFADFKAGEYDHIPNDPKAQKTKSRAIKWSDSEILKGFKWVIANNQKTKLTLEQALSEEARVKMDWYGVIDTAPEVATTTGIKKRYVEFSTLFLFGARQGENSAVLKLPHKRVTPEVGASGGHLSFEGIATLLPLRVTTAFFSPEEVELARQLSVTAPAPAVVWVNQRTIQSVNKQWADGEYLKSLKRLVSRLHYWNDIEMYNLDRRVRGLEQVEMSALISGLTEIAYDPQTTLLNYLSEMAMALAKAKEIDAPVRRSKEQRQIQASIALMKGWGFDDSRLHGKMDPALLSEILKQKIQQKVQKQVTRSYWLKDYIEFALKGAMDEKYRLHEGRPLFISFALPSSFIESYRQWYIETSKKYPHAQLTQPDDLHMTIAFMGAMDQETTERFWATIEPFRKKLRESSWTFTTPRLSLMGEGNTQVALVYNESDIPQEAIKTLFELKAKLSTLGVRLDRHANDFLPHISVAYAGQMHRNRHHQRSIHDLLLDASLLEQGKNLNMSGEIKILTVDPDQPNGLRYSSAEASDMNPIDVNPVDFD